MLRLFVAAAFAALIPALRADDKESATIYKWQPKADEIQATDYAFLTSKVGSNTQARLRTDGLIENTADMDALLGILRKEDHQRTGTYILNVLKWKDPAHTETQFNKWYLYDAASGSKPAYLSLTEAEWLTRSAIPGRQNLFLVYLHFPSDSATGDEGTRLLQGELGYVITITKQKSQFDKDLASLISVVKPEGAGAKLNAARAQDAYFASFAFKTGFEVCSVSITAAVAADKTTPGAAAADKKTETRATSPTVTYIDEAKTWRGLSFAVPVASYKDVTFDKAATTLTPKTVTRQNTYACFDLYCPAIEPSLIQRSYLPHAFVGLPLTGKVLKRPMAGVAVGHYGIEVFYSAVYDMENQDATAAKHPVWKFTYGVKLSIDAGKALLAKATGK
jgi:hypothetical protein